MYRMFPVYSMFPIFFFFFFFSSPYLKVQVSFSDQNFLLFVVVIVNFSHFLLLFQNYWVNQYQPNLAQIILS
jgi:hypothetical protein